MLNPYFLDGVYSPQNKLIIYDAVLFGMSDSLPQHLGKNEECIVQLLIYGRQTMSIKIILNMPWYFSPQLDTKNFFQIWKQNRFGEENYGV